MPISDYKSLDRLSQLSGIIDSYHDIRGVHHVAGHDAKQSLLTAMHIPAGNDAEIQQSLEAIKNRAWQDIVAPTLVYQQLESPQKITLILKESQIESPLLWQINEEQGQTQQGIWELEVQQAVNESERDGTRLLQFEIDLPPISGIGYHRLNIQLADGLSVHSLLIVTPDTCYQPCELELGKKVWGIGLQLYSLRSKRNWGIGDFTDLNSVVNILAPLKIDVIGLNPLHTLFPHLPENASPYSPSSRDFINPIYLDIEVIEDYESSEEAQKLVKSETFQTRLNLLRAQDLVNYTAVWSVKMQALELLYRQFQRELIDANADRIRDFRQFQNEGDEALRKFGVFESLQVFFHQQDSSIKTWQQWPGEYQNPDSDSVKNWVESNADKIEFHQYLQWQAEKQLTVVQQACISQGMCIGIYSDLAIGNESASSACWTDQSLYAQEAQVGAPPDDFNLLGQNWGLPPQIPQVLSEHAYRPFIRSLRANMRHAGALRIDHIMGLMRLYWVPANYPADQGTYVTYPFEDLLGILALESRRNRCLIIGEDLGTVPDDVRHTLWLNKILSYRILFFEKDWHHGTMIPPGDYPRWALCSSGSHDLPTLKGFWQESDLDLRETLNLYPTDEIKQQQRHDRAQDRNEIMAALVRQQLIAEQDLDHSTKELSTKLFLAIQLYLARSEAFLMMVQLEDMLSQINQLNVPGTTDEYPNWRHKILLDLEDWCGQSDIENISFAISQQRSA